MNRSPFPLLAGGIVALLPLAAVAAVSAAPPTVTVQPASKPLRAYDRAEFTVTLAQGAAPYANPFDPDEIAVDAVLTGPQGRTLRVPAFWQAPYMRRTAPDGKITMTPIANATPGWRVRIAPPTPGAWKLTVTAKDRSGSGTSAPLAFTVAPAPRDTRGFVRRATGAGRKRYFQYDSGASYFMVGENVCWSNDKSLADFDAWFPSLSKAGGNFARLWMSWSPLESKESGLGRYDLANAAYFDEILDIAQKNHIGCMLAFGTYGEFNTGGYFNEGQWPINPYSAANGGPVPADTPEAFFTNETARKFYKRRLRYLIARYSAFTSLAFWEFWNEKGGPGSWFGEMSAYVKATDPHKHLVTDSFSTAGTAEVWSLPDIDLTQTHRYGDEGSIRDIAPGLPADVADHMVYDKPHLMGEFGISWRRGDENFDTNGTGINLHNGLWAGALSGAAGGAMIWWWDSYVHPKNLYPTFTGLANFAKTVDWPRRAFEPITLDAPTLPPSGPETFSDLELTPVAGWGSKTSGPILISQNGQTAGNGTVIAVLFGPEKPNERSVLTFDVDLPRPSTLTLRIKTVSKSADLRIGIDGKETARFPFDAAPGKGQDFESTKHFPEYNNIYQAVFNKDRQVSLPAGKHRITLENADGDWIEIGSYRFSGAVSSRYARIRPYALQDATNGETLVWLQDPESNWANDREGKTPQPHTGAVLRVPVPSSLRRCRAEWWDTRKGVIIQKASVEAKAGVLTLAVPTFTRDIALRLIP